MNKTEFLLLLERRLIMLNDEERNDLITEYTQHIDMKVASGLSEEEAIADFGDPEELIKALLEAYHLNTNYQPVANETTTDTSHPFQRFVNGVRNKFDTICHKLSNSTSNVASSMRQKATKQKEQHALKQANKFSKAPSEQSTQINFTTPLLSLGAVCKKLLIWCCKFIAFFIFLGIGLCTLTLLVTSAAMLVFVLTGYAIVGPFFVVLGCTLLSLVLTGMLMQFVFGIGGASV